VWFAGVLAVVAATTLAFVLVLTVRRRRHDLALLRTLGFDRRNVRTTVLTQALTLVVPGALLGIVIGLAGGRVAWSLTTDSLGAPSVQVTPVVAAVSVLAGALVIGWLASAIPGRLAARLHPAAVLRTE
jgi:ABC-type antimicrobial peptide transport system permease subunit